MANVVSFERAIMEAIEGEIGAAIEAETERAIENVRSKIRASSATIAMSILRNFDLEMGRDEIVIRVRDTVKETVHG